MKKIISLYQRNYETDRLVRNEVVQGAEWVLAGEGIATRKFDGTAVRIKDGKCYRRHDAKKGKTPPPDFEPAQQEPDPITGHWPGWVPVTDKPADKWYRAAFDEYVFAVEQTYGIVKLDGTYELCGPHFQGNPEHYMTDVLVTHGTVVLDVPRDFNGIRQYLETADIEGIVWHHPDGRMVKIKKRDFGFRR